LEIAYKYSTCNFVLFDIHLAEIYRAG